ncbi:MAG: substrate-binding domain-containing protein, partial [Oscillospiraceae bacterium]|nr:substrate-binding domain-containing protein [Oscillospiraceae bacterium]
PSICFDNKSGMRECIEHLVTEHKCTKIGFVSGPDTNSEAIERMSVYAQVLRRHGIFLDQNRIAYGNFSPYSQDVVRELLDRCPDLEAIVFANDSMALGAYEVFKERNIEVGRDILVTGFDNVPDSATVTPPLTTVNADASELGYNAVIECQKIRDNIPITSQRVRSTMVKRRSCGCLSNSGPYDKKSSQKDVFVFNHYLCRTDEQTVSVLCKYLFDNYKTSGELPGIIEEFTQYFTNVFKTLRSDDHEGITLTEEAREYIPDGFESLMTIKNMKFIDHDKLCRVMDYLTDRFVAVLESADDKKDIALIFINMYQIYIKAAITYCESRVDDMKTLSMYSSLITKDLLLFDSYDDSGYGSITGKLRALNIRSSYLYVFEDAIVHKDGQKWYPPETVLFKSYHNEQALETFSDGDQTLSVRQLLDHKYIPKDRRLTMVLSALFFKEDHYGLLLCELDPGYFHYINSLVSHLCAAMKILRLMRDKDVTQPDPES